MVTLGLCGPTPAAAQIASERDTIIHGDVNQAINQLSPDDKLAEVAKARAAIEEGDYDRADALLAAAEDADLARLVVAERERRFTRAAARRAERGDISLTRLRYREAADHFRETLELLPAAAQDARLDYRFRHADALYEHGLLRGVNASLEAAIAAWREQLAEQPRTDIPLQWAMTQNNLGNALVAFGTRESGTTRLEAAVAAYTLALEERTRDRAPLQWATTQNNLDSALWALGKREHDAHLLRQALHAIRIGQELDVEIASLVQYAR